MNYDYEIIKEKFLFLSNLDFIYLFPFSESCIVT